MNYINIETKIHGTTLAHDGVSQVKLDLIIASTNRSSNRYYQFTNRHSLFYKILSNSDRMLKKDPVFRQLPLKEQKEWLNIRNLKTGDRGYLNRYLIPILKKEVPEVYSQLIEPHSLLQPLDIAPEIDSLLLARSIPSYFKYMERLNRHKKGVFSNLQRAYIGFLQMRALNLVAGFLKDFEQDLELMTDSLLSSNSMSHWADMTYLISGLCEQADPNHHDPLSLNAINCLRSIYVSLFNIAMLLMRNSQKIPLELRHVLPIIPDKLNFSRTQLEADRAWGRYQDHQFLFMRLPKRQATVLAEKLGKLSPVERVIWMGSLGRFEIRSLILQIVSHQNQFLNLAQACREIRPSQTDQYNFTCRVWKELQNIYQTELRSLSTTPVEIHHLFEKAEHQHPTNLQEQLETTTSETDLSLISDLSFLVVDDSRQMRQMTIKVLKEAGIGLMTEAADGQEAWHILQKQSFDVILCDWIMPKMTGIELVQKVMQIEDIACRTSFIMLTTINNKSSIVEALSVGVRGYLIKPFSRRQLLEKVYFATEWHRKEQQALATQSVSHD